MRNAEQQPPRSEYSELQAIANWENRLRNAVISTIKQISDQHLVSIYNFAIPNCNELTKIGIKNAYRNKLVQTNSTYLSLEDWLMVMVQHYITGNPHQFQRDGYDKTKNAKRIIAEVIGRARKKFLGQESVLQAIKGQFN